MDVRLGVFWGLYLDNKVDTGDVQSTGRNIGGDQHVELLLLEALQCHFTLVLGDVTVHDLDVLLDLVGEEELVGLLFGRGEDDALTDTIADEDVSKG